MIWKSKFRLGRLSRERGMMLVLLGKKLCDPLRSSARHAVLSAGGVAIEKLHSIRM